MAKPQLQILSMDKGDPNYRYAGGLVGCPVRTDHTGCYKLHHNHHLISISLIGKRKLNEWAKANGLPRWTHLTFYIRGDIGFPSTPEELAYDEIDQQDDIPAKLTPRVKRSPRSGSTKTVRKRKAKA